MNEVFAGWLETLGQAWETRDARAAAHLFSADVYYCENPFDPPLRGREEVERYWQEMIAEQEDITFSFEILAVTPERSVVNWRVSYADVGTRERSTVDGVSVGTFNGEGLCERWLEWWHKAAMSNEQRAIQSSWTSCELKVGKLLLIARCFQRIASRS